MNAYRYFVIGVGWLTMMSMTASNGFEVEKRFVQRRNRTDLGCEQRKNGYRNYSLLSKQGVTGDGKNRTVPMEAQARKGSGQAWRWR